VKASIVPSIRPQIGIKAAVLASALLAGVVSCRHGPPSAIPTDLVSCIPPGALALAGANLDALRASSLFPHLPASALDFLKPLEGASHLLTVFNGADILLAARGHFREAAPGATLAGSDLMLSGSPALIQAALAQRRSGVPASKDLVVQASNAAAGHALWIVTRGSVPFPLSGDAANLNRLLRNAQFATAGLRIEARAQIDFTAQCAAPDTARELEETLRAFLSLSAAGLARRQPELAAVLRAANVQRDGGIVRASIAAQADSIGELLDLFAR